jgi:hypothetical protein
MAGLASHFHLALLFHFIECRCNSLELGKADIIFPGRREFFEFAYDDIDLDWFVTREVAEVPISCINDL